MIVAETAAVTGMAEYEFRIANNRWDCLAAYRLVYETYLHRGLIQSNHFRLRVTPYHLLPTTHTFLAFRKQQVVCCVSLIGDAELGLPMECIYHEEVNRYRARGFYVGEVSCLASQHEDFRTFLPVFIQLTRVMAQHARRNGMDQLLCAVRPKHARFYERFLGFRQVGPLREHPIVHDAPAVACCLDFERIDRERPDCWTEFFGTPLSEVEWAPSSLTEDDVEYFRPAAELNEPRILASA